MSQRTILASFAREEDLLAAVEAVKNRQWDIVDVFSPYPVHGLEHVLGWRRSLLPVACFLGGIAGVALALWFQFWTSAQDWPLNVGGRPWNSLPAFVPVAFESMVLVAGFALVFAWLFRCRLYPGRIGELPMERVTDDRFALVIYDPSPADGPGAVEWLMRDCRALAVKGRDEVEHI